MKQKRLLLIIAVILGIAAICKADLIGKNAKISTSDQTKSEKKRAFKDLVRFESYENLNSEITGKYDKAHAVKCVNGTFVGTEEYGVASWLGIPYAKPPVGKRRFKAPEYVEASDRVFEAKYYGKGAFGSLGYDDCIQKQMSEDCLYLNIWLNTDDKTKKKPVMVWIHGGAYVVGSPLLPG